MIATIMSALGLQKWMAIAIEIAIIAAIAGSVVFYITNLQHKAAELKTLQASEARISAKYGCSKPIESCLEEREELAAQAKAKAEATSAAEVAAARTELGNAILQIQSQSGTIEQLIKSGEDKDDGAVPKVLTDTWAAERARRGVK